MTSRNNQNRSNPKQEIPVMNKDEIASLFVTRAHAAKSVQFYRTDGSPIVGALISHDLMMQSKQRIYKGKRVDCKLLCCSNKRPPIEQPFFSKSVSYDDPYKAYEPQPGEWVSVQPRSVRRLKTRAKFANADDSDYNRPNAFYAMSDD